MKLTCQSCSQEYTEDQCVPARDLGSRFETGDVYSEYECPDKDCGAICVPEQKLDVYTGFIEHKHGFNHYVASSELELNKIIAAYCEEYHDDAGDPEAYKAASTPEEKVSAYFQDHQTEFLTVETCELLWT